MNYKANFKAVIIAHLIAVAVVSIAWFFVAADGHFILKIVFGALMASLVVQALIYKIKPGLLNNKIRQHPDQQ